MSKRLFLIACLMLLAISGCSIEQQQILGANSDRQEGFSGYGTKNVRYMEGPLMDMMVPDNVPKGRADATREVADHNVLLSGERNLSWTNQGINRTGARILSNRPGTLHDKYSLREKPDLSKRIGTQSVPIGSVEQKITNEVEQLETIEQAYVVKAGEKVFIGVQSTEPNKQKLRKEIEEVISSLTDLQHVYIATDRRNVNRIRSLQGARGPIEQFGNTFTNILENR